MLAYLYMFVYIKFIVLFCFFLGGLECAICLGLIGFSAFSRIRWIARLDLTQWTGSSSWAWLIHRISNDLTSSIRGLCWCLFLVWSFSQIIYSLLFLFVLLPFSCFHFFRTHVLPHEELPNMLVYHLLISDSGFLASLLTFSSFHLRPPSYGQFQKLNLEKWDQPLGYLNFQRACRRENQQWFWDLRPSIWNCANWKYENWPYVKGSGGFSALSPPPPLQARVLPLPLRDSVLMLPALWKGTSPSPKGGSEKGDQKGHFKST